MADFPAFRHDFTGITMYAVLRNAAGEHWDAVAAAFETLVPAEWVNYDIAADEDVAGSYQYHAEVPATLDVGFVFVDYFHQTTGTPLITDTRIWTEKWYWDGTEIVPLAADARLISGDATAADNLEAMLDDTGGVSLAIGKVSINGIDTDPAVSIVNAAGGKGLLIQSTADNGVWIRGSGADVELFNGTVRDDSGNYIKHDLNPSQALSESPTATTVGSALYEALAAAGHKVGISGTTLTLYKADGVTAYKTFTLDDGSNPSTRTPD